jgi:hypothetical protein
VDDFAAGAIAALGLVNAIAVLASAVFLATSLEVVLAPVGAAAVDAQLMYRPGRDTDDQAPIVLTW